MKKVIARATILCLVFILLSACGGNRAPQNSGAPNAATQPTSGAQSNVNSSADSASNTAPSNKANVPQACALLTTADVKKISGYGGGLADSQDLSGGSEGSTGCTITAGEGKIRVEVGAGSGLFPYLTGAKTVELEGGAKGIAKDSGIGQDWMNLIEFPKDNYSVTLLVGGTATKIDPDNKIAQLTKADGSTMTYAEVYEALARAVARNGAVGAPMPSSVSKVEEKGDPCALLTLDEVKAVMTEFDMTGPESAPSAFGGNMCRFRGRSDSLKTAAIVSVVYLTEAQFNQAKLISTGKTLDLGGVTAYDSGEAYILNKGAKYVRFSIVTFPESSEMLDQINTAMQKWLPQLGQKIAARLGQ
ncbi:MAG: hypothetical protein HY741_06815 [Chloroflexi bacterium]|nr:hypothetical protein [Chloroflexota bacterium]